jgi:hypothetical protein
MSLSKSLFIHNAGRLSVVVAFSLLAQYPAAADSLVSTSGNIAGGGVNNVQANQNGGPLPARNGKYNLEAFASDSLVRPDVDNKKGPVPYGTPTAEQKTLTDSTTADQKGTAFDANSLAQITYPVAGNWNSAGSYASVCGPVSAANPGGNLNPCGQNPNGETAKALAQVRDPWSFAMISTDLTFDNTVTFSAGLSLQALSTGKDFAESGIQAEDSTDLDGLGKLWTLSWGIDSIHPGIPDVVFWSNPALGLNDALITSSFESLLNDNVSTGMSTLTQSFSFEYQLTIPANTTAQFTGSVSYDAAGATGAPEPSSLVLALLGASFLIVGGALRKSRARNHSQPVC